MTHPLADVIDGADKLVLIGDSTADRFPAASYHAYVTAGKAFYCLDLGGLTEARGPSKGGVVYASPDDIPDDHGDLAVIWVTPRRATEAVDIAHDLGCTRVWFSFLTGHRDAVARAKELGMKVVEVGRCPVYFMDPKTIPFLCRVHVAMVNVSGTTKRPPVTEADSGQRELW